MHPAVWKVGHSHDEAAISFRGRRLQKRKSVTDGVLPKNQVSKKAQSILLTQVFLRVWISVKSVSAWLYLHLS